MAGHSPREARLLGLWTAGWLALLLIIGVSWLGTWALQWWVLVLPALWALIALLRGKAGRESN